MLRQKRLAAHQDGSFGGCSCFVSHGGKRSWLFLQAAAKDTTVFVLSDQGFGPIPKEEAEDPELSGAHEIQGILFCKGPGFRKGFEIQNASIYDFLPTLLHAAGLPVAKDMKGRALIEAFQEKHPVRKINSYGARNMRNGGVIH